MRCADALRHLAVSTPYAGVYGLSEQIGGRPRDWQHVKDVGTPGYHGRARRAEAHWFQAKGVGSVKSKVKEWLD